MTTKKQKAVQEEEIPVPDKAEEAVEAPTTAVVKEPPVPVHVEVTEAIVEPVEPLPMDQYKLSLYTPRGVVKASISTESIYILNSKYRDIAQTLPANQWIGRGDLHDRYKKMCSTNGQYRQRSLQDLDESLNKLKELGVLEHR